MSDRIKCKDCRFYDATIGTCHRYPPLPMFVIKNNATGHPFVFDNDWCGMAERREDAGAEFVTVGKVESGDAVYAITRGELEKMKEENNRLRKLMCEIRDLFDWRGQYRGTSPLKSECLMEIYAIASEEDEKRRIGK